ncbi:MAG TPA: DUF6582 domain-containing protein [Stellaceae bacterium]|nr:DUF6582 domain-containing protein [Stellaceae bacterium]
MKLFVPIAKVDAEQRMVWGYASTPARDDQGEIVTLAALNAALPDYMRFANIREMHQLSAVGVAKEAAVDDRGLFLGAKVVDPLAWDKVREGVYKGFSIGGRVVERNPSDRSVITAIQLNEISLVDRPANPEAVFDCWKAAKTMTDPRSAGVPPVRNAAAPAASQIAGGPSIPQEPALHNTADPSTATQGAVLQNPVLQIWDCGDRAHRHISKAEALKCAGKQAAVKGGDTPGDGSKPYGNVQYADPGYQQDGKKRYPIDTEAHIRAAWNYICKPKDAKLYSAEHLAEIKRRIVAAWKEKIDPNGPKGDGPPEAQAGKAGETPAFRKALEDLGEVAWFLRCLDRMRERLEVEAICEGDANPGFSPDGPSQHSPGAQPARLAAIVKELADFLNALAAEETAELIEGEEYDPAPRPAGEMRVQRSSSGRESWFGEIATGIVAAAQGGTMQKTLEGDGDRHLLEVAHTAVHKALQMNGLPAASRGHLVQAREALKAAGTVPETSSGGGSASDPIPGLSTNGPSRHSPGMMPGGDPTGKSAIMELIEVALGKRAGHQHLMDLAYDAVAKMTDGMTCAAGPSTSSGEKAARHSAAVMEHLHKAHYHLCAAGAVCDGAGGAGAMKRSAGVSPADAAGPSLPQEAAVQIAAATEPLLKALKDQGEALAQALGALDALGKDVAAIKATPLPPATVKLPPGVTALDKTADGAAAPAVDDDALLKRLAAMSEEERTMLLIKASYRNPFRPAALSSAPELRAGNVK